MTRASKPCTEPSCSKLQPCPIPGHTRKPWQGSTRSKELPKGWDKKRRYILQRDPICTLCTNALSTEVHHTGHKDNHSPDALAGVCKACHANVTTQQAALARRARRA